MSAERVSPTMREALAACPTEWRRYTPGSAWATVTNKTRQALKRRGLFETRSFREPDPTGRFAPGSVTESRITEAGLAALAAAGDRS